MPTNTVNMIIFKPLKCSCFQICNNDDAKVLIEYVFYQN